VTWAFWLVLIPTVCYGLAAVAYGIHRDWPYVVVFTGYALANCGFLAIEWMKK
jgi:hypothetical protein